MYNNDLLIYICNLIDDHNLTYILSRLEDRHFRSRYLPKQKTIIINTNWWYPPEVPFMAAHELGHYINGDKELCTMPMIMNGKNMTHLIETMTHSRKIKLIYIAWISSGTMPLPKDTFAKIPESLCYSLAFQKEWKKLLLKNLKATTIYYFRWFYVYRYSYCNYRLSIFLYFR